MPANFFGTLIVSGFGQDVIGAELIVIANKLI
jgi:hypothetical protein